jgi:putative pyruvate formate lyase activating enzyme
MSDPSYLALLRSGELAERVRQAYRHLEACDQCGRRCGVNRRASVKGAVCRTGERAMVASYGPHHGEEDVLRGWRGSGTIFFTWCNLRCVFCFHPDTFIPTDQGLERIADLFEQGENGVERHGGQMRFLNGRARIITRSGTLTPVVKAFRHDFVGDLILLKPFNCPPLLVTPDHEVFAIPKADLSQVVKVRADRLTKDDYLIVPKRLPGRLSIELDIADLLSSDRRRFRKSPARRMPPEQLMPLFAQPFTSYELAAVTGYHPAYVRKLRGLWRREQLPLDEDERWAENELIDEDGHIRFKTERRPGIPKCILLDEQFAWLLGIYCAEGHITSQKGRPNSHRLVFSFGHRESSLVERTVQILQELFGVQPQVCHRRTTMVVEVGKASLALLFAHLCGKDAHEKQVPPVLVQATSEVLRSFLQGVLDGDGCDRGTHLVINTVSEKLAMGLFEIGLLLGMVPSFHCWQAPPRTTIEGREVNQAPLYYVKFLKEASPKGRRGLKWRETEAYFMMPVHKIERVSYEGPVFNLEIDDPDHSYLAPFVAVSNCQNFEISQMPSGREVEPEELAAMMLSLQARGCHNINLVSPTHVVAPILAAVLIAAEAGLRLPLVYNTGGYDSLEALALLDGVTDIYMPDMKYGDAGLAKRYSKVHHYPEVNRAAVKEMHRQVGDLVIDADGLAVRGLLVRHLVLPGGAAGTAEVVRFLAEEISPNTYVNVMAQYRPCHHAEFYPEIDRPITDGEYQQAIQLARDAGLKRLDKRR